MKELKIGNVSGLVRQSAPPSIQDIASSSFFPLDLPV